MSFFFIDTTARAAWAAATTQQGQLEGLRDLWSGQMSVRYYSVADAHLATVTHATPIVDPTTTPRSLRLGAWVAESHVQDGTAAYCILAVPAGADILRCDVLLAGAISDPGGRVRLDIGTTLRVQATSTLPEASTPTWRTAMVDTDTVYEIGSAPTGLAATIDWPAAGVENFLMNGGGDSNPWRLHASYGGSVFVPELGAHGTMIFGRTGEATIDNQLTAFPISDDSPAWAWFQQPDYPVSEAEAITAGSDWYYSEADYAALPAGDKIDVVGEATFSAAWDGTFPVGYKNWVARRKHQGSITGNSRPWFFRYNMPRYIPPAMAGTANGAIVVTMEGTKYGPFGQNPTPTGAVASDWFADVWPSGNRKNYLYAMDVQTKEWQRLATPIPDYTAGGGEILLPVSCVESATKRIHYLTISGTDKALYYADFSAGLAGMTITTPVAVTDSTGGAAPDLDSNSVLCEVVGGALDGKALWLMKDSGTTPAMLMIDLSDGTYRKLTIASLPTDAEWWAFAFDQDNTRVIITSKSVALGVKSYRATIPTDYTNAAAWSFTATTLTLGGVSIESGTSWQYGDRCKYIPGLDAILMTQIDGKMLAYRPGA